MLETVVPAIGKNAGAVSVCQGWTEDKQCHQREYFSEVNFHNRFLRIDPERVTGIFQAVGKNATRGSRSYGPEVRHRCHRWLRGFYLTGKDGSKCYLTRHQSQSSPLPNFHRPRFSPDQITQRIRRVIAAHALLIRIHLQYALGPIQLRLQCRKDAARPWPRGLIWP